MRRLNLRSKPAFVAFGVAAILALISAAPLHTQEPPPDKREAIGELFGEPVYRDEIRTGEGFTLKDELHRLFTAPVLQKYREDHKAEIEPTEQEIDAATAYFDTQHRERIKGKEAELRQRLKAVDEKLAAPDLTNVQQQELEIERTVVQKQLTPPGRFFASFMLNNWKLQKHLYDEFGGGRILFQQAGVEAFDAYHKWLGDCEQRGDFKIADHKLRETFYEYWTTMDHGAFLTDDQERVRQALLEPEWLPEPAPAG
jgi:hypothetical protein